MSGNLSSNQVPFIEQKKKTNPTNHDKLHQDQASQIIFLKLFLDTVLPSPAPSDFQHGPESGTTDSGEVVVLPRGKMTAPPRLLICYSSRDGPAHVKAVMQLGAFIQQHLATQVGAWTG